MDTEWLDQLWQLHETHFPPNFDWNVHLQELNESLALEDRDQFGLPTGLAPSWFVGDVEALGSEDWVLVVQLNQARRPEDDQWHLDQNYTVQTYWDHWRFLNRNWWEPRAYRQFVRLAAGALGVAVTRDEESEFATRRLIFVELCPYPSQQFELPASALDELIARDVGFQVAAEVRRLLLELARPSLILVSGVGALEDLESVYSDRLDLTTRRYTSSSRDTKELWHKDGWWRQGPASIPLIGFPFMRKPHTHNSYDEIDQLGGFARQLLADGPPS